MTASLSDRRAWRAGIELAVEMFNEATWDGDERLLTSEFRDGRPQDNFVYDFLCRLRNLNHPQADIAFAAALSDALVVSFESCQSVNIGEILDYARNPVPQRNGVAYG